MGSSTHPQKYNAEKEDFRLYYEHQYDRMKELEQQRLTMTNVIMGLSAHFGESAQLKRRMPHSV